MKIEKLKIKHLSAYLPYRLQVKYTGGDRFFIKNGDISQLLPSDIDRLCIEPEFKPILRPLSDLTKEIEVDGKKFVPIEYIRALKNSWSFKDGCFRENEQNDEEIPVRHESIYSIPYFIVQLLFEWKIDVFGLIEQNLAININDIK